jgi:hypothetical protein
MIISHMSVIRPILPPPGSTVDKELSWWRNLFFMAGGFLFLGCGTMLLIPFGILVWFFPQLLWIPLTILGLGVAGWGWWRFFTLGGRLKALEKKARWEQALRLLAAQTDEGWLRLYVNHRLPLPTPQCRQELRDTVSDVLALRAFSRRSVSHRLPRALLEVVETESAAALTQMWRGAGELADMAKKNEPSHERVIQGILEEWRALRWNSSQALKQAEGLLMGNAAEKGEAGDPMKRLLWQLKEMEKVDELLSGPDLATRSSGTTGSSKDAAPPQSLPPAEHE